MADADTGSRSADHESRNSGDDPGARGSLRIDDRVAERLATHAAVRTSGVHRYAAGLKKITGRDLPSADVTIAANRAAARVKVAVDWPLPAVQVARTVQSNVAEALQTMAGLVVDRVDVEVAHIGIPVDTSAPRRVQ